MTILTVPAALALALTCPTLPASLAPIMVGISEHESGLNTTAINHNTNGSVDVGLAQVNSSNFGWLGLTMQTATDPCLNLSAGARVLFAKYNGNPPDSVKAVYSAGIMARLSKERAPLEAIGTPDPFTRPSRTNRDLIVTPTTTGK